MFIYLSYIEIWYLFKLKFSFNKIIMGQSIEYCIKEHVYNKDKEAFLI